MTRFVRMITTPVVVLGIYGFLIRSAWRETVGGWRERREDKHRAREVHDARAEDLE